MKFTLKKIDSSSKARLGVIETTKGTIETPVFMPVGTRAAVKTLTTEQLKELDPKIILANTYHLLLRPGPEIIKAAGGIHKLMRWDRPILTDSGGFQVFSLSDLNKITDEGVTFQSHIDGSKYFLGPKESMEMQKAIGSDIVMAFDECSPYPCDKDSARKAMERTHKWEKICRDYPLDPHQNLFGIVQGGMYPDLREESATTLAKLDFEGYAIGGLSVGEPYEMMKEMIQVTEPFLPKDKPRYLMGVGTPRNIIESVMEGIDMFDCVMPTRNARNGTIFTWQGKISIKAGKYAKDFSPLDPELNFYASKYSKAYVRHLFNVNEVTGLTIATLQSLAFYLDLMQNIRKAIEEDTLDQLYQKICAVYPN